MIDKAFGLADEQRGVLARFQMIDLEIPPHVADDLLRSGRFTPLDPPVWGVHRVRGSGHGGEQQAFAAALRCRPDATVTGPLVLGLLRVPGFSTDDPFEILLRPGRRVSNVDFRLREDPDPGRAVASYGDIRTASPLDALIDAAAFVDTMGERTLRAAVDHMRWTGLIRTQRLQDRLDELRDLAPGAQALHDLLAAAGGAAPESEGERGLFAVLQCFEPRPEPQVWIGRKRRVDFLFRAVRMAYEYLGAVDHETAEQRIADDERDAELRREGLRVQYITAADLRDPVGLMARIAGALVVRAHEVGARAPRPVRNLPRPVPGPEPSTA